MNMPPDAKPKPDADTLRNDLEQLRKDFKALSEQVKHRSREQVQAGVDDARDRIGGYLGDCCKEIEARPFTSIIAAFGAGLLLGKIFGR